MRVLIADDEFTSRKILQKSMEMLGERDMACNGREAWEAFQASHRDGRPYELILLDIIMPEMDGYESTRAIRSQEKEWSSSIPIVACTANVSEDEVRKCLDAGMDDALSKPYKAEILRSLVEKRVSIGRSRNRDRE